MLLDGCPPSKEYTIKANMYKGNGNHMWWFGAKDIWDNDQTWSSLIVTEGVSLTPYLIRPEPDLDFKARNLDLALNKTAKFINFIKMNITKMSNLSMFVLITVYDPITGIALMK